MDPDKVTESIQLAGMLYQAVLSLNPAEFSPGRQVHRMARALALAEVMATRAAALASPQEAGPDAPALPSLLPSGSILSSGGSNSGA